MLRSRRPAVLVFGYHDMSVYDFFRHRYYKYKSYDPHRTNPVIEKYFSKYKRGDLITRATMGEILNDSKKLADLRATVDRIRKDLQGPLEKVTEEVNKVARSGIRSNLMRYPSAGTESRFSKFLNHNANNLSRSAEFFRKYTEFFLIEYIKKEIREYGEEYDIPDGLFERLALLSEFDGIFTICEECGWDVTVSEVLSVINGSILDAYGHLSRMLWGVQPSPTYRESTREIWTKREHAYKYFTARTTASIQKITDRIRGIKNKVPPSGPRGIIRSDGIYDVTSPGNQAGLSEKIDLNRLKDVIKRLNNIEFNKNEDERRVDEITPLEKSQTFKYSVGSKQYFLKSFCSVYGNYCNSNDILFERLNSRYIVETYRILYNHVVLENNEEVERFWILSGFLPISAKSIDWKDMNVVRKLASDVLNGLDYLRSERIIHDDLHFGNIQGERVEVNGKTEYRFKIIDFGWSYPRAFNSGTDNPDLLRVFGLMRSSAKPAENEKPVFDDFISECMRGADIKGLLLHRFIMDRLPSNGNRY